MFYSSLISLLHSYTNSGRNNNKTKKKIPKYVVEIFFSKLARICVEQQKHKITLIITKKKNITNFYVKKSSLC